MELLIDTHTLLWMAVSPEKLSGRTRTACTAENLILSVARIREISIKFHIGRLALPADSVAPRSVGRLPEIRPQRPVRPHARSQCLEEKLSCVSPEPFFAECGIHTIR
jgi:PIN domain nuclease of toxin-antitoxin system